MSTKATDPEVFDIRIVRRQIERGVITQKAYEKHLADLPDKKSNACPVEATLEHVTFTPTDDL